MPRRYTEEQKQQVFQMKEETVPTVVIAGKTGISQSTIRRWISNDQDPVAKEQFSVSDYLNLQRRYEKLQKEIEVLHRVNCSANAPTQEKLLEAEALSKQYSVHVLCDALKLPRGTFYNHILRNKRENTVYAKHREELKEKILEIYHDNFQILGTDKIVAILKKNGIHAGSKTVQNLMNEMGLSSVRNGAKRTYRAEQRAFKNHVQQKFDVQKPNQVWVGDTTLFRFHNRTYYICAILDLYSRKAVGYGLSNKNSTQLVKKTFLKAYSARNPSTDLIFHSDRGSNFQSETFRTCLAEHGVVQSFSKPYTPHDNAVIESFFSNMKKEELYRTRYRSESAFKKAIDSYITFYNTKRPHSTNNYLSPDEYESRIRTAE